MIRAMHPGTWMAGIALLLAGLMLTAAAARAEADGDIAIGATVRFSQPPLYDLTADDGDARQLTDGREVDGTMWMSRDAVGWSLGPTPLRIDIDLGQARGVGRVCLHTARRAEAGVVFPVRVDIFTSTDETAFAWAGRMTPLAEAGTGEYLARSFCSREIGLLARHVTLQIDVTEHHFFTDEITISGAEVANSQPIQLAQSDLRAFTLQHEAIAKSLAELTSRLGGDPIALSGLQTIAGRLDAAAGTLGISDLSALDHELRRITSDAQKRRGPAVSAAFCDPWSLATPFDGRTLDRAPGVLEIGATWHGTTAIALEHAAPRDADMRVSASVKGDGATALTVSLYSVEIVTRADGVRLGDALLQLTDSRLRVPMGETRQLWIDLAAGPVSTTLEATLTVKIETEDGLALTLEQPILIYPPPRGPKPAFTVVWGYLDSLPIKDRPRDAALDMLAHGVTTAVLPAGHALPWPRLGTTAGSALVGDYGAYDAVMQDLAGHEAYLFFLSLNSDSGYRNALGSDFMSERWQTLFTAWIREWTGRLKAAGIGPDRFAFYPVDEPNSPDDIATLVSISKLVRAVDPALRIYTTLYDPQYLTDDLIEAADIVQLNGPALNADAIARIKARGKLAGSYATTGGGKSGAPDSFYRALGWDAFARNLDGFGFWAYAETGISGTAWNDIDDVLPDFAVVYDGDRIISSKRWEAWREGVQDNELLRAAAAVASDPPTRARVYELAEQARTSGYTDAALTPIRRRLRLIAETGRDPGA